MIIDMCHEGILKVGMRSANDGLYNLIAILPRDIVMAEIGCYAGESTLMFMKSDKVRLLYAIDTWEDTWEGEIEPDKIENYKRLYANMKWAEQSFDIRMHGYNVIKYKCTLSKMKNKLPPLDFIYIDGDHRYEYVKEDIILSLSIIKKGGIIAGHDYDKINNRGVIRAVDEIFGKPDKIYKDTSWIKYLP